MPKKKTSKPSDEDSGLQSQLEKLLLSSRTPRKIINLLNPLKESEKRRIAPFCLKHYRKAKKNRWNDDSDNKAGAISNHQLIENAATSLFCVGNFTEIKSIASWEMPDDKVVIEILQTRKPGWCLQFADRLLHTSFYWNNWPLVREMVRLKLCPKPEDPRYYTGMISGLCSNRFRSGRHLSAYQQLKADPALLKDEVWKLFEYEGDDDNTLANVERWSDTGWSSALLKLSNEKKLSRGRLLECSLSALELGFNHYRSDWFMKFFDRMSPTDREIKKHADKLLGLISSPISAIAMWAFEHSKSLFERGIIRDVHSFSDSMSGLLLAKHKSTVLKVLNQLAAIAEADNKNSKSICLAACEALAHEKVDVQKATLKMLKKHCPDRDTEVLTKCASFLPVVSASFRKQLKEWIGSDADETSQATGKADGRRVDASKDSSAKGVSTKLSTGLQKMLRLKELNKSKPETDLPDLPAIELDFDILNHPPESDRLKPPQTFDELLELLGRVIEDDENADEVEMAFDGLARLGPDRPENFKELVGPVFKRAKTLVKRTAYPFRGVRPSSDLAGLICCWVNQSAVSFKMLKSRHGQELCEVCNVLDKPFESYYTEVSELSIMSERSIGIAKSLAENKTTTLLSTPTHRGGWIEPKIFIQRVNSLNEPPTDSDLILALLRLSRKGRNQALKQLKRKGSDEWLATIKYALGGTVQINGKNAPIWAAASRSRNPFEDDQKVAKKFPKLGLGCTITPRFEINHVSSKYGRYTTHGLKIEHQKSKIPKLGNALLPTQLVEVQHGYIEGPGAVNWAATIQPAFRVSFFEQGASRLAQNIDWWEAEWLNRNYMLPLLDEYESIQGLGMLMLFCGLAAKEPGEHGLATDIFIRAIADGRIGTDNFSAVLCEQLSSKMYNLTRIAKRLTDISQQSSLHAYVVFKSWEIVFSKGLNETPKGLGDVLECLLEISAVQGFGIESSEARSYLQSLTGSSKSAKNAKQLLESKSDFSGVSIFDEAVAGRVAAYGA